MPERLAPTPLVARFGAQASRAADLLSLLGSRPARVTCLRIMRRILPFFLLSSVAAWAACSGSEAPTIVASAVDLGRLEQSAAIQGRDGGYSAQVFARSVWIYGDSILSLTGEDGSSWRNNTWSHTPDLDASDGLTGFVESTDEAGAPRELFGQTEAERAFNEAHRGPDCQESPCGARWALWPGPIVWDPVGERALIVYTKIYGEPGPWNFHGIGTGIAVWSGLDQPVQRPVVRPDAEHPTLLWSEQELNLGSAAVVEDGMLYLFGCHGRSKACKLGRAPLDAVHEREAWRYYAGAESWSADADDAVGLFEAMDMTSVHWNAYVQAYVAFYSPPFENRVMLRTAPALIGPWSAPMHAFDALAPTDNPDGFAYSGLGHAELQADNGRVEYVSYYRGTQPWFGEIRLVRVELDETAAGTERATRAPDGRP